MKVEKTKSESAIFCKLQTPQRIISVIQKAVRQKIQQILNRTPFNGNLLLVNDHITITHIINMKFILKIISYFEFIQQWTTQQLQVTDLVKSNNLSNILHKITHINFENLLSLNLFYLKINNIEALSLIFSPNLRFLKIDQNQSNFGLAPLAKSTFKQLYFLRLNIKKLNSDQQFHFCNRGLLNSLSKIFIEEQFSKNETKAKNYGGTMIQKSSFLKPFCYWMHQPHILIKSSLPWVQDKKVDKEWLTQNIIYYDMKKKMDICKVGIRNKRGFQCFLERFIQKDGDIEVQPAYDSSQQSSNQQAYYRESSEYSEEYSYKQKIEKSNEQQSDQEGEWSDKQ